MLTDQQLRLSLFISIFYKAALTEYEKQRYTNKLELNGIE